MIKVQKQILIIKQGFKYINLHLIISGGAGFDSPASLAGQPLGETAPTLQAVI